MKRAAAARRTRWPGSPGCRWSGILVLCWALGTAGCTSVPRIDGSSDHAFERSHKKLVESLAPADRLRLLFAEAIVLAPRHCLTTKPIPGSPFLTKMLGGQTDIAPCRRELDGMSYRDIIELAYPHGEDDAAGAGSHP